MDAFRITDSETYCREYARLGDALGVPGAKPAAGEVEFLAGSRAQSRGCFGMLSEPDIFFAGASASILCPQLTVEIGTASGSSAAILAKVVSLRLQEPGLSPPGPLLHTIDNKTHCLFNAKPIGFAIDSMAPAVRDRIILHQCDSSDCSRIIGAAEIDFALWTELILISGRYVTFSICKS